MRKKALVFLDYDMLIRHFILSGVFNELERRYDVTYVFHRDSTSEKQGIYADIEKLGLKSWTRFEVPRARMGRWDKLYSITALNAHRGTPNFRPRKEIMAVGRRKWLTNYYHFLSLPWIFPIVQARLQKQMGVYEPLLSFVREQNPDIIFHPSILAGYFINELLIICQHLAIPFVVAMNSWDNPSTKSMNTGHPDKLVVWGPQTTQHAIEYLGMPPEDVVAFGAAQFQLYRVPVKESREELCTLFNVSGDKPLILYGGGCKGINESCHLKMLDDAIETNVIPPCHIIYRPHPWRGGLTDGEENFFDLSLRHISMDPHMEQYYRDSSRAFVPGFDLADYHVTKKLLHLVDAVISPLSTILLESIIFGKPVLVFYTGINQGDLGSRVFNIGLRLAHFKDFWGVPGVDICADERELARYCHRLLLNNQDATVREGLKRHATKFVVMDGPTYGERLVALADELTGQMARSKTMAGRQ